MTTSVTRPCFTTQHQTCKTKTTACKTKTIDRFFLLSDRSCPKTDGLRPHHCFLLYKTCSVELGQVTAKLVNFFLSLTQREAPVTRKTANIIPVSKTSLVSGPYVLRPISVTPILSRTVEKLVVKNYLTQVLKSSLFHNQYACLSTHWFYYMCTS